MCATEGINSSEADSKAPKNWDQIKLPGLRPSMSVSDIIGQIGQIEHRLSEEKTSGNLSSSAKRKDAYVMLDHIAHHLLSDNHVITDSDEKSLMSRVNSLCCLLQEDPAAMPNSHDNKSSVEGPNDGKNIELGHDLESTQSNKIKIDVKATEEDSRNVYSGHQAPGMSRKDSLEELLQNLHGHQAPGISRKDSFGDLLLNLPRITSLPKFLFNISED